MIMSTLCFQYVYRNYDFADIMLHTEAFLSFEKVKVKQKVKKRKDIQDKYDIRNCPFHLNYWTTCLINDHLITIYDNDIFLFNQMFDEAGNLDGDLFKRCFRYTRDYCNKNKKTIHRMFSFFRAAFYENLRKMDGYDERMEKWYEETDAYLRAIREDSEN